MKPTISLLSICLMLIGCESAPTQRSTAVLPPVDKGAALPYPSTVHDPAGDEEPVVNAEATVEENIVAMIQPQPDPAPPVTNHIRRIKPRWMSNKEWGEFKARGYK